jgi:hypothetical protein
VVPSGSVTVEDPVWVDSLTVNSGATLTFNRWHARVAAGDDVTVAGTVRHGVNTATEAVNGEWAPNARAFFTCADFDLTSTGVIDTDGRGYQGPAYPVTTHGRGPGGGLTHSEAGCGGGHGGRGHNGRYAWTAEGTYRGPDYDSAIDPTEPGSSGGRQTEASNSNAGHGGGAVRIEATGTVTLNGTIKANGTAASPAVGRRSGGGSGGSISIQANVIQGTTGRLEAKGGNGGRQNGPPNEWANGGGGGGGRIAVQYDSAAQAASPVCTISFASTAGFLEGYPSWLRGEEGTVYLPDAQVIAPAINDGNRFMGFNNPRASSGDVTIGNGALVSLVLTGGTSRAFYCGGDLTVKESGRLYLYGGVSADFTNDYSLLDVAGSFVVTNTAIVYPVSDATNGGSVLIRCSALNICTNGLVDANGRGFRGNKSGRGDGYGLGVTPPAATGHSFGLGGEAGSGGGYGGRGGVGRSYGGNWDDWGQQANWPGGVSWGVSNAPVFPGSSGGMGSGSAGGNGGGLVRIEVSGDATIDGIVRANGNGTGSARGGGGSGGGIYIRCARLRGTGSLTANGGSTTGSLSGGGGGGRIALWRESDKSTLSCNATGGTGAAGGSYNGAAGTVFLNHIPSGTLIILR